MPQTYGDLVSGAVYRGRESSDPRVALILAIMHSLRTVGQGIEQYGEWQQRRRREQRELAEDIRATERHEWQKSQLEGMAAPYAEANAPLADALKARTSKIETGEIKEREHKAKLYEPVEATATAQAFLTQRQVDKERAEQSAIAKAGMTEEGVAGAKLDAELAVTRARRGAAIDELAKRNISPEIQAATVLGEAQSLYRSASGTQDPALRERFFAQGYQSLRQGVSAAAVAASTYPDNLDENEKPIPKKVVASLRKQGNLLISDDRMLPVLVESIAGLYKEAIETEGVQAPTFKYSDEQISDMVSSEDPLKGMVIAAITKEDGTPNVSVLRGVWTRLLKGQLTPTQIVGLEDAYRKQGAKDLADVFAEVVEGTYKERRGIERPVPRSDLASRYLGELGAELPELEVRTVTPTRTRYLPNYPDQYQLFADETKVDTFATKEEAEAAKEDFYHNLLLETLREKLTSSKKLPPQ